MIVLRKYKDSDVKKIENILIKENIKNIEYEGITYVVLDSDKLIGVGNVQLEKNKYYLKYIVIKKEERNKGLGDALLRAMVFSLENNNISKLYFRGNNEYLLKKGFKNKINEILFLNIKDLFSNNCKCPGGCYGI